MICQNGASPCPALTMPCSLLCPPAQGATKTDAARDLTVQAGSPDCKSERERAPEVPVRRNGEQRHGVIVIVDRGVERREDEVAVHSVRSELRNAERGEERIEGA